VIEASGAPALLMDRFALEYHAPWHVDRDVSHLFRGQADAAEADALLEAEGHASLRLVDNGAIVAPMPGIPRPHAYHLIPRAASKARAVAFHMRARGYAPEECVAVGDSQEDMGAAAAVGTFWLVANGAADATGVANVRRCAEPNGAGVYEAVLTELAERR
jgi:hydroxymethylpyrimidine pyrophosphatase-like HAD family hydrolase